jgi:hypothetical protein
VALLLLLRLLLFFNAPPGSSAGTGDPALPMLHVTTTPQVLAAGGSKDVGDAVGLVYNAQLARFELMWDSKSACGWGHVSTTDFLTFTDHGCAGPNRTGGPTMSGSIVYRPDGMPLAAVGWLGDVFLSTSPGSQLEWFSPPPGSLSMAQAAVGPSNCRFCPALPVGKRCLESCSRSKFASINSSFINDPFLFARKEEPDRLYLLTSGSMRDQNGPTGVPQSLLWASDEGPRFQAGSWKFIQRFWSGNWEAYGPRTSCVDTFPLSGKQIFMFSDCKFHRVRWFVGSLTSDMRFNAESEGFVDWGRLYASQSMDAPDGRRLLLGNIGHPNFCTGPKLVPIGGAKWNSMLSLPRQVSLDVASNRLRFAPADELRVARVSGTHAAVMPTAVTGSRPVVLGSAQGNTREVGLSLHRWLHSPPGGACGFHLRGGGSSSGGGGRGSSGIKQLSPSRCVLEVMFSTAASLVVRSWCGASQGPHGKTECLRGTQDAFNKSTLAGYCYNVSLPLRANASQLTAVMDRSAVEVFAAQGELVISSGVFVERASAMATVELVCEGGAEAVMTAEGWLLARPNSSDQVLH